MNAILKNNPKTVKPKTTQAHSHKKIKILKKKPIINEEYEENTQMESDSATNKSSTIPQEKESKLIVEADEEIYAPKAQKIKTREEEKLENIFESASFFNENILKNRVVLNKEFLKMKLESSCLRENKLNVFFNVPFFPKAEMFPIEQLNSKSAKNKFALITRNSENINGNIKSYLDSSIVNNEVHIINLGPKKRPQRPPNYAVFGLYKENHNLNNNIKDNNVQTRHRNIFSSIFPNKNKSNEEEPIEITDTKEPKKKVIEIKEDDEDSSSSYNPTKNKEVKLKANNGEKEEMSNDTSKLKIMAERYKKNKEKLKKNIGEKKFRFLENILIKKNYIKKNH